MSPFTVLVLCLQVCLIQTVMSQTCGCGSGSSSSRSYSSSSTSSSSGGYGGSGSGNVNAAGNIEACGTTCVEAAVPVLGSASFGGCADACGSVSICGKCGCGCQ